MTRRIRRTAMKKNDLFADPRLEIVLHANCYPMRREALGDSTTFIQKSTTCVLALGVGNRNHTVFIQNSTSHFVLNFGGQHFSYKNQQFGTLLGNTKTKITTDDP
ncbi:hypothetical protein BDD14_2859 [Edaphobacter modestus]|uniref:Uncharacterized protein n=1 Tax=Edaphobacter modestus TaxID=388466 RepID=A0A4Q7YU23_9BACT|nr:hypothetical protein BDD14_2859 [Edaphobacter modestus]